MIRNGLLSGLLCIWWLGVGAAEIQSYLGSVLPDNAVTENVVIIRDGGLDVFEFNGKDSYITTPVKLQAGKSFAFSAWVKPDFAKSRQAGIIVQPGYHNFLGINGAKQPVFSVYLQDNSSCSASGPALESHVWYMLSGVYDAEKNLVKLYLNGKPVAETDCAKPLLPNSAKINIGASRPRSANPQYFAGKIAMVHLFDHAPDAAEIIALYQKESVAFPVSTATTVAPGPTSDLIHTGKTDVFTADCLASFPEAEFRKDVETLMLKVKSETVMRRQLLSTLERVGSPRLAAVKKRTEIFNSLLAWFDKNLSDGSREMLLFAWCAQGELRMFANYFNDESILAATQEKLPPALIFNVKDFGAKADGQNDDGPAIRQAIAAAIAAGKPAKVFFPAGVYRIIPEKLLPTLRWTNRYRNQVVERPMTADQNAHLIVCSPEHLTLEGEAGTTLLMSDPAVGGIRLLGGYDTMIKNIAFDYEKLPFTQGVIESVNPEKNIATVKIDPGYPAPDLDYMLSAPMRRITMISPQTRTFLPGSNIWPIGKIKALGANRYEIEVGEFYAGSKKETLVAGNLFDLKARRGHGNAAAVSDEFSKFTTFDGVVINSSPSVAFQLMTIAATLRNCAVEPPTGSSRLISSNADGVMVTWGLTLVGPYMENCRFNSIEDDGINLHSGGAILDDISDGGRRCQPEWLLEPDSELYVLDGLNGQIKAVTKTVRNNENLEFYPPLPASVVTRNTLKQRELSLKETLDQRVTYQIEKNDHPDVTVVARSQFGGTALVNSSWTNVRGLGVQLTAPSVWVEDCTFDNLTGSGISITSLMSWGLYYSTHNSVIRNCNIRNTGGEGIIVKCIPPYAKGIVPARSINSILIENNQIGPCKMSAVLLDNCYDVQVTGNRFIGDNTSVDYPKGNFGLIVWKDNSNMTERMSK